MTTLDALKEESFSLDVEIASLLNKRLELGKKIVEGRKAKNLPVEDLDEEEETIMNLAKRSKIDEALLNEIYFNIFDHIKNS